MTKKASASFNRGAGLYWLIPLIEWQFRDVPVKINAVVWYRIFDPKRAMLEVRSVDNAVIQVALTTLRTGIGQYSLDDTSRSRRRSPRPLGTRSTPLPSPGA
jgi:SPFH domain / Band 7 family